MLSASPEDRRYISSKSFPLFFLYYFFEYVKYDFADFHFDMFTDIEDLFANIIREILWLEFRESAKTSLAKGLLTWIIVHKKRFYLNVDSFDKENAERTLFDTVGQLQTNKYIIQDFGQLFNTSRTAAEATQKRVNNFITNNGVRVEAHSTAESVRGRIHGSQRPDFLLLDDFETNKTKDSKAYTLQVIKHIDEFKGGLDATAKTIYLGNYITEYGSIQELLKRAELDNKLRIRNMPIVMGAIDWNNIKLLPGSFITWPQKFALTDLEALAEGKVSLEDKKKQLGSSVFNSDMMNRPIDELTQEIFKQWFRFRKLEDVEKMVTRKFATIDTALSEKDGDDYSAITKNYVDMEGRWNVAVQRYRINSKQLVDIVFQLHDQGFEKIGIEKTAYLGAIKPWLDAEKKKRNKYPHVVELQHKGINKETRIRGVIPRWEAGDLYLIEGMCDDLMDEAIRFPKSPFDDCLDSLQYQTNFAEKPYVEDKTDDQEEETQRYPDIGI